MIATYQRMRASKTETVRYFSEHEDIVMTAARIAGWSLGDIALQLNRPRSSVQMRLIALARKDKHDADR